MDAEIKKKLEEMARESYAKVPWQYVNNSSFDSVYRNGFMSGAQAAWTLAVGWERERIKNVIESAGKYTNGLHNSIFNTILTPEEEKT